ncbi:MAG: cysteine synthase A [Halanaerobiales bacterium]
MSKDKNINDLIGSTPLVKLNNIPTLKNRPYRVFMKLEMFNPGGSIKDRIALNMIKRAEKEGKLKAGSTIVEPTSGNTGIGLALIGSNQGYNVILVMPDTMSQERRDLLKAYGAKLVLTPGDKGMKGAIEKARELVSQNQDYFQPDQFINRANPDIHRRTTGPEILIQSKGNIDYFVAGVGTGGTITGVGEVLKSYDPQIEIVAVEPKNSAVISGENPGPHSIQGIGAGFIPDILNIDLLDRTIKITAEEAKNYARLLSRREGILGGVSTGANLAASIKLGDIINQNSNKEKYTIVTIAPDTGERYLSTDLYDFEN